MELENLLSLLTFLYIFFIGALLLRLAPLEYVVTKSIIVNQPKNVVFDHIRLIFRQREFSKFQITKRPTHIEFYGDDGLRDYKYRWDSRDWRIGSGLQKIRKVHLGEGIDTTLELFRPNPVKLKVKIFAEYVSETQTRIVWKFFGEFRYPENYVLWFYSMDIRYGIKMKRSLNTLKKILNDPNYIPEIPLVVPPPPEPDLF